MTTLLVYSIIAIAFYGYMAYRCTTSQYLHGITNYPMAVAGLVLTAPITLPILLVLVIIVFIAKLRN